MGTIITTTSDRLTAEHAHEQHEREQQHRRSLFTVASHTRTKTQQVLDCSALGTCRKFANSKSYVGRVQLSNRGGGAMVARLTPVQKVASSILVRPRMFSNDCYDEMCCPIPCGFVEAFLNHARLRAFILFLAAAMPQRSSTTMCVYEGWWRNGSAPDSSSEGCELDSRPPPQKII